VYTNDDLTLPNIRRGVRPNTIGMLTLAGEVLKNWPVRRKTRVLDSKRLDSQSVVLDSQSVVLDSQSVALDSHSVVLDSHSIPNTIRKLDIESISTFFWPVRSRISSLPRIEFTILGLVAYRVHSIRPSSILSLPHIEFTQLGLVAY
jgi:hypothetical protein